ncbi:MAG TPA: DUF4350 domain-containing protein [Firmicutes bacterium]|nr:DUF4350 domain-containing protein [Bacillota bacterium]
MKHESREKPERPMRPTRPARRERLFTAAIVLAGLLLLVTPLANWLLNYEPQRFRWDGRGPRGMGAARQLLEELGFVVVEVHLGELSKLSEPGEPGTLLLFPQQPDWEWTIEERENIRKWTEAGGSVVIFLSSPELTVPYLLSPDIREGMSSGRTGSRRTFLARVTRHPGIAPGDSLQGIKTISLTFEWLRFDPEMWNGMNPSRKMNVLAEDDLGPMVVAVPGSIYGDNRPAADRPPPGWTILVMGTDLITNEGLAKEDNAAFLVQLLHGLGNRRVVADVALLGEPATAGRAGESPRAVAIVGLPPVLFLQLLVLFGLTMISVGQRFGPLRPLPTASESIPLPYHVGLGRLYARIGHPVLLIEPLYHETANLWRLAVRRGELERRLGPPVVQEEWRKRLEAAAAAVRDGAATPSRRYRTWGRGGRKLKQLLQTVQDLERLRRLLAAPLHNSAPLHSSPPLGNSVPVHDGARLRHSPTVSLHHRMEHRR